METGTWQSTPVNGWCFYAWPFFWSEAQNSWYFTAEPGDEAWSVSLKTGIWSIFGDVSVLTPTGPTLSGQVLNFDDGSPVEGAIISLEGLEGNSGTDGTFSIPGILEAERVVASIAK